MNNRTMLPTLKTVSAGYQVPVKIELLKAGCRSGELASTNFFFLNNVKYCFVYNGVYLANNRNSAEQI